MHKQEIRKKLYGSLPLKIADNQSFYDYIQGQYSCYISIVSNLYKECQGFKAVESFIKKTLKCIKLLEAGKEECAKLLFQRALTPLLGNNENNYNGVLPVFNKSYNDLYCFANGPFIKMYRATDFKESILHIPFDKTEHIGSNRFTAKGIPCLYLGDSIETCLAEIGNYDTSKLFISCFELDYTSFKILDLTCPDIKVNSNAGSFYDAAILSWPVVALCMVKQQSKVTEDTINWAYIFPQLILTLLAESKLTDIKAVKYSSTKNSKSNAFNIAIPAQQPYGEKDHCEFIKEKFTDDERTPDGIRSSRVSQPVNIIMALSEVEKIISDDQFRKLKL